MENKTQLTMTIRPNRNVSMQKRHERRTKAFNERRKGTKTNETFNNGVEGCTRVSTKARGRKNQDVIQ